MFVNRIRRIAKQENFNLAFRILGIRLEKHTPSNSSLKLQINLVGNKATESGNISDTSTEPGRKCSRILLKCTNVKMNTFELKGLSIIFN